MCFLLTTGFSVLNLLMKVWVCRQEYSVVVGVEGEKKILISIQCTWKKGLLP